MDSLPLNEQLEQRIREARKCAKKLADEQVRAEFLQSNTACYKLVYWHCGEPFTRGYFGSYEAAIAYIETVEFRHYVEKRDRPAAQHAVDEAKAKQPTSEEPVKISTNKSLTGLEVVYEISLVSAQKVLDKTFNKIKKDTEPVRDWTILDD